MSIIKSILDNDLYKFTVSNGYFTCYPYSSGVFTFKDRNRMDFPKGFKEELVKQIELMSEIQLSNEEYEYMKSLKFFPPTYLEFLKGFRYDPKEVRLDVVDGKLEIDCTGYMYRMTLWEVPLLALISETYQRMTGHKADVEYVQKVTAEKAQKLTEAGCIYTDFGTRRRFSLENQERVVQILKENSGSNFLGTSNVYFAMKHNVKPIGTHPHEWMMFHAAVFGYKGANNLALSKWRDLYRGYLCTALTDTFTTDVFFREFDRALANSYDGVRHDSECPFKFADKCIEFYKRININPMAKNIIFSDSLTYKKAIDLQKYCEGKIKCSFGIGTHFTCDTGSDNKALNIVMKLTKARLYDDEPYSGCVKLSDAQGKHMGTERDIQLCKLALDLE